MSDSRLQTAWAVRAAAGEPFAVVRVKNLQTVIRVSRDAWGRPNETAQPLLISAEVSFVKPFDTAASNDKLGTDTVHYGNLSKAILATLDQYRPASLAEAGPPNTPAADDYTTLDHIINMIWAKLTAADFDGWKKEALTGSRPFLDPSRVRFLSVTLHLPKASLLGEGISLTASSLFEANHGRGSLAMFSRSLRLHSLRIPTLIGVNAVERQSKQFVVATIELDKFDTNRDVYTDLESLVVREFDSSSFETLEALGAHLAHAIRTADWFKPVGEHNPDRSRWQIKIGLEKPTAVPFADAPVVEIATGPNVPR